MMRIERWIDRELQRLTSRSCRGPVWFWWTPAPGCGRWAAARPDWWGRSASRSACARRSSPLDRRLTNTVCRPAGNPRASPGHLRLTDRFQRSALSDRVRRSDDPYRSEGGVMEIQFMTSAAVIAPEPASAESCISRRLAYPWPGKVAATCTAKALKDASPSGSGR
jgi:hypothetical protein